MAQSWKSTLFTRPPSLPCPSLRGRHGSFANPAAARKERNLGTRGRSGVRRTLDGENQARAREAEKPRGRLAGAGSGVRGPGSGQGPGQERPKCGLTPRTRRALQRTQGGGEIRRSGQRGPAALERRGRAKSGLLPGWEAGAAARTRRQRASLFRNGGDVEGGSGRRKPERPRWNDRSPGHVSQDT